jgi:hypothetical protein
MLVCCPFVHRKKILLIFKNQESHFFVMVNKKNLKITNAFLVILRFIFMVLYF